MTTVAIGETARMPGGAYQVRRTEAMPKASLFGSLLEMQTDEGATSLKELDPSTVRLPKTPTGKGAGQRFTLSEEDKNLLPGAAVLERSRREFETQRRLHDEHTGDLRKREEESLYNLSRGGEASVSRRGPGTPRTQWFTDQDLKGAKEINSIGLNEHQSFNHDKYGPKAPVHNYSNIGDILRPGMDFPRRERSEIQMRNLGYGTGDLHGVLATGMTPKIGSPRDRSPKMSTMNIPPNIKHQFGSRVCDKLLSDKGVVEQTIRDQKDVKESNQRKNKPFTVPLFTKDMNPDYEMLSNAMRMNVVPGYTMSHKTTTTKTDFNDKVHLFRYQDPDKWRYQKDELSKWAEHNVLRQKMTKAWEQYFIETTQKKNKQ